MSPIFFILFFTLSICDSKSIGASERNVTKRQASPDLFPDWVPFKNKHGDELGEFIDIPKAKPKKRLAPPMNFVLKAIAEPEGDEAFETGQGESDNEDYYEKKDWSDLNRPAEAVDKNQEVSHTDIAEIDGIVNIITKPADDTILKNINPTKHVKQNSSKFQKTERQSEEAASKEVKESKENLEEKKPSKYEDEADYEENKSDIQKPPENTITEEERKENEEKKAKILSSVDELKQRHAEEQRSISERVKEEELSREELEKDRLRSQDVDNKYSHHETKWKKIDPDYDIYDDLEPSKDKYRVNPFKESSLMVTTTKRPKTKKQKNKTKKTIANGKLSVFRNPNLYTIKDEDEHFIPTRMYQPEKYSSKYSSPSEKEESVRISLVPEDNDTIDGEPTMFFPKKRKTQKRIKTTPIPSKEEDTADTESAEESAATSAEDTTGTDAASSASDASALVTNTAPTASESEPSAPETAPSAPDTAPSASDTKDSEPAPSEKEDEKKHDNYSHKKGGGKEHSAEHEEEHEEHGKKAYEGVHKETKTKKGHHDKEDHLDKYKDHGGVDESHHEEDGHYGAHHHEEHGKKHAKYEESGKHSKGHSTKGSHDIHKKEEYEKNVEFFEEEGDSAEEEHHGGHHSEKEHSTGGHFKKSNLQAGHGGHEKGEKGHFHKSGHAALHKGHRASSGHDHHAKRGSEHHKASGGEGGKKWVYHHGYPAKTANLILIDKRVDGFQHGPRYYG